MYSMNLFVATEHDDEPSRTPHPNNNNDNTSEGEQWIITGKPENSILCSKYPHRGDSCHLLPCHTLSQSALPSAFFISRTSVLQPFNFLTFERSLPCNALPDLPAWLTKVKGCKEVEGFPNETTKLRGPLRSGGGGGRRPNIQAQCTCKTCPFHQ